jgi:hypothetical protein
MGLCSTTSAVAKAINNAIVAENIVATAYTRRTCLLCSSQDGQSCWYLAIREMDAALKER